MLNKYKQEIDLKQTFEDDDDLNMVTVDDAAFSHVTDEGDLDGYGVEEPEVPEEELLLDEEEPDDYVSDALLDDEM